MTTILTPKSLETAVPTIDKAQMILQSVFGYTQFRHLQKECIERILQKQDTLLIMPTGGGKSLCYQIPALLFPGLTVVISPLIALMQDQVSQLKALGVEAEVLNSSLSWDEYSVNKTLVSSGQTKLLFLAPETLLKEDILKLLKEVPLDCITIDEAHCISEWGHDFRTEYRELSQLRALFPQAVTLAMTATATARVRLDIKTNLKLNSPRELVSSFNRSNLFYEVIPKAKPLEQTVEFLNGFPNQSGIIYCLTRRQVDELTAHLQRLGFKALPYHAGLSDEERTKYQNLFIRDDVPIMVATIAFGMGINKPNVRFILHYDLPKSLESYYQETGRAGRDGLSAHCLLLFGYGELMKIRYFIDQKSEPERTTAQKHLEFMVRYAQCTTCRRVPLLKYFGEDYPVKTCGQCDGCSRPQEQKTDITLLAQKFLAGILRTGQRFGAMHVIDVLRGKESPKVLSYQHQMLDVFKCGREFSVSQWQFILQQLREQHLVEREEEYGVLKLTAEGTAVLKKERSVEGVLPRLEERSSKTSSERFRKRENKEYDSALFEELRRKRKDLAEEEGVPSYIIFPDQTLLEMCQKLPRNYLEFAHIFGVGKIKLEKYAAHFLKVIKDYAKN